MLGNACREMQRMAGGLWTICVTSVNGFIFVTIHKLNKATGCSEPQVFFSLSCVALGFLNQSEFVVAISLSCFGSRVSY